MRKAIEILIPVTINAVPFLLAGSLSLLLFIVSLSYDIDDPIVGLFPLLIVFLLPYINIIYCFIMVCYKILIKSQRKIFDITFWLILTFILVIHQIFTSSGLLKYFITFPIDESNFWYHQFLMTGLPIIVFWLSLVFYYLFKRKYQKQIG
jgi:hypothetical protein